MLEYIFGILAFPVVRDDAARDELMHSLGQIIDWWISFIIHLLTGGPHG